MARPRHEHPTPGELEILKILWETGPATGREVMEQLSGERGYTTVTSLLNVMTDKGLLKRTPAGRAFSYAPAAEREQTLGGMVGDLLGRAFEGSACALVNQLLAHSQPSDGELAEIRRTILQFQQQQENQP